MMKIKSGMFEESSKSHASSKLWVVIVLFVLVFLGILIMEAIIPSALIAKPVLEEYGNLGYQMGDDIPFKVRMEVISRVMSPPEIMIPTLICTVFGTIISIVYCRFGEMRSLGSIGMRKKKLVPHYLTGLVIGTVLMSAIVLLSLLTGTQKISSCSGINYVTIAGYMLGWFIQGMSEEFIFRGYLMNSIGGKHKAVLALTISSVAFSLAHTTNPGFGPLVFFNLALFGLFAALYMLLTDDIWGSCAIHSVWNFVQGNIFGISVSGSGDAMSFLRTSPASESKLLTGGEFGIEGSIFTTIVMLSAVAAVAVLMKKKKILETE